MKIGIATIHSPDRVRLKDFDSNRGNYAKTHGYGYGSCVARTTENLSSWKRVASLRDLMSEADFIWSLEPHILIIRPEIEILSLVDTSHDVVCSQYIDGSPCPDSMILRNTPRVKEFLDSLWENEESLPLFHRLSVKYLPRSVLLSEPDRVGPRAFCTDFYGIRDVAELHRQMRREVNKIDRGAYTQRTRTHVFILGHDDRLYEGRQNPSPSTIVDLRTIRETPSIAESRFFLSEFADRAVELQRPVGIFSFRYEEKFGLKTRFADLPDLRTDNRTVLCASPSEKDWLTQARYNHMFLDGFIARIAKSLEFMRVGSPAPYANSFILSSTSFREFLKRWRTMYEFVRTRHDIEDLPFRVHPCDPAKYAGRESGLFFERATMAIMNGMSLEARPIP